VVRKLNFQTVSLADLPFKGGTQPRAARRPIVLIVNNEAVIADTRAMILELSGISAMVAYDGKSALEIAHTAPPDLLLTDVAMPGINGVALAIAIRRIFPNCGNLLFSGQASSADLLNAAREAGLEFTILTKPLHPTELLARISDALQSQSRDRESGPSLRSA
jgi:DNA-binding response OmpR family regulator